MDSNKLKDKKILLTGGVGFIGSHLVKHLIQHKVRLITIIDNADVSNSPLKKMGMDSHEKVRILRECLVTSDVFENLDSDYDYIIHMAGVLGIRKVSQEQLLTLDVNVLGTRKCLEFAKNQRNLQRFIFISTSEVYGQYAKNPFETDNAVIPTVGDRWCYAAGKLVGEYLTKGFAKQFQVPGVIIRPFNVYGSYRNGANAMTSLISRALRNEDLLISGDGQQTRSWCHIDDFINGLIKCLVTPDIISEAFNIGNDSTYVSLFELANLIKITLKSDSKVIITNSEIEDVINRKPNINKAKLKLGYFPKIEVSMGIKDVASSLICDKKGLQ